MSIFNKNAEKIKLRDLPDVTIGDILDTTTRVSSALSDKAKRLYAKAKAKKESKGNYSEKFVSKGKEYVAETKKTTLGTLVKRAAFFGSLIGLIKLFS